MAKPSESSHDNFVDRLVPDPSDVPDLRAISGFPGRSSRPKHVRVYLTLELSDYVEIPQDGVVHKESLQTPERPLGGVIVWVKREAKIHRVRSASREAQADFLRGSVAALLRGSAVPCPPPRRRGFQVYQAHFATSAMSCVHEFCDFTINSFLGGGSVYCTEDGPCGVSSAAECP
jgi:hypothetical protein